MGKTRRYTIDRRTFVKGGLAASALAALAGCGRKDKKNDSGEEKGGVLDYGLETNPACIDPYNARESQGSLVTSCLFSPLTKYDFKAKQIKPCACERWEMNEQGDDGNGRLGRLLITLSLLNDHAVSKAVFYPSYQLKLRHTEYYAKLMDVREKGHFAGWLTFFCERGQPTPFTGIAAGNRG